MASAEEKGKEIFRRRQTAGLLFPPRPPPWPPWEPKDVKMVSLGREVGAEKRGGEKPPFPPSAIPTFLPYLSPFAASAWL